MYIGTSYVLYTGYRSRGKRIKNIEHVLPGINNIRKAKCRGREKFALANLMGTWPQRFGGIRTLHQCRTRQFSGYIYAPCMHICAGCYILYNAYYARSLFVPKSSRSVRAAGVCVRYITYIRARRLYTYLQPHRNCPKTPRVRDQIYRVRRLHLILNPFTSISLPRVLSISPRGRERVIIMYT